MEKLFYTADDISKILGYSKTKAYGIIKQLNIELKEKDKNIIIFPGRINKNYFDKRIQIKEERE